MNELKSDLEILCEARGDLLKQIKALVTPDDNSAQVILRRINNYISRACNTCPYVTPKGECLKEGCDLGKVKSIINNN